MAQGQPGGAAQASGMNYVLLALALLCATLSYADRQVIALVVKPIKAAYALSDTQIGLLQGIAFSLCYAIAGLPLAWAADRWNRVRLASACVAVWSLATASCGLVSSYAGLVTARALTAVSEASFSPAVQSVMADRFPPGRIARISAIYLLGPALGMGSAMFGGGMILQYLEAQGGLTLGGMHLAPWQGLFVCVGAPGLLLALIFLLVVREPARTNAAFAARGGGTQDGSFREALRETGDFLVPYIVGSTTLMLMQYAQAAWAPTFFERSWGFAAHSAGQTLGPISITLSIAGAVTASHGGQGRDRAEGTGAGGGHRTDRGGDPRAVGDPVPAGFQLHAGAGALWRARLRFQPGCLCCGRADAAGAARHGARAGDCQRQLLAGSGWRRRRAVSGRLFHR